jgi:hypothetical protein
MIPEFDAYNTAVMSNRFTAIKMNGGWNDYREGHLHKPQVIIDYVLYFSIKISGFMFASA